MPDDSVCLGVPFKNDDLGVYEKKAGESVYTTPHVLFRLSRNVQGLMVVFESKEIRKRYLPHVAVTYRFLVAGRLVGTDEFLHEEGNDKIVLEEIGEVTIVNECVSRSVGHITTVEATVRQVADGTSQDEFGWKDLARKFASRGTPLLGSLCAEMRRIQSQTTTTYLQLVAIAVLDLRFRSPEHLRFQKLREREEKFVRAKNESPVNVVSEPREVASFMDFSFRINDQVMTPRSSTQTLVRAALRHILPPQHPALHVLDLGCGCGNLLLSFLLQYAGMATGTGIDISRDALLVARQNAKEHCLSSRVDFVQMDMCNSAFASSTHSDLVVFCNPPYLRRLPKLHTREPTLAMLAPFSDPLYFYRHLAKTAAALVVTTTWFVEVPHGSRQAVMEIFEQHNVSTLESGYDNLGYERYLVLRSRGVL